MSDEAKLNEVQLLSFGLGKEDFGVDVTQVREILQIPQITNIPNSPEFIEGVINLRGQITTVVDLRKRLGIGSGELSEDSRIIIVELEGAPVGMIVDFVSEVIKMPLDDIDPTPSISTDETVDYIRGVGKLEDKLLVILDIEKVLSKGEVQRLKKIKVSSEK